MQSHLQRWEGQGTTTFNWINQEKDKQITAVTRSCNSSAHLTESVSWTTIQDAVAKVKHDQEEEEQRLMGKGPSADVEPATVEEAGLNEFTLKLPCMASAKLPESTKSAAVSKFRKLGHRRKADGAPAVARARKAGRSQKDSKESGDGAGTPSKAGRITKKELLNSAIRNINLTDFAPANASSTESGIPFD